MSTRQLRLNTLDQIQKRIQEFTGKKINIVLHDNTVILAVVRRYDNYFLEADNMRQKRIKIPFTSINEIYYDTKE
jgi:hypothetical protein